LLGTSLVLTTLTPQISRGASGPLPLSAYPRPSSDNGFGMHWTTNIYGQQPEVVDYFVAEMAAMGVKWVKFLNDGTEGRQNEYLIDQLVAHDMMPIMRIYFRCNRAFDLASLRRLVEHYVPKGVYYYELFNEPDLAGEPGGWCDGETPDPVRLARLWAPAARVVQEAGGYPSLPAMGIPSTADPDWRRSFFIRFLEAIRSNGDTSLLYRTWGAIHNYFLNHPLRYPYDDVNLQGTPLTAAEIKRLGLSREEVQRINHARAIAHQPRAKGGYYVGSTIDEDNNAFLAFLAYHDRFYEIFGFEIPLISTEGGVTVGSSEDPRYPRVTETLMAERTLAALEYMLDEAPPYYFAFTSWLIGERALDNFNPTWESWAWYKNREGDHLPVVEMLKRYPRRGQTRRHAPQAQSDRGNARVDMPRQRTATPIPTSTRTRLRQATSSKGVPLQINPEPLESTNAPPRSHLAITDLSRYPRPQRDNGWGIHWSPTLFGQPTDVVDYFVNELTRLDIRWVKLMQPDSTKLEHEYLVHELVKRDIMPVLRVYKPYNDPYEHLDELVRAALPSGVYYYELYNEPNIRGNPGGWRPGEQISVERILDLWIPAAAAVSDAGGYPALPTLAPGGDYDDLAFLRAFLDGLAARGRSDLLTKAWIPLHNYFLNHPLTYPYDEVNQKSPPLSQAEISRRGLPPDVVASINHAREIAHLPRAQGGYYVGDDVYADSNGFLKFQAYHAVFRSRFGFDIPIISTEGGAIAGNWDDPRYPPVDDADVTAWTLGAFAYMLEEAPAYYFAFTPWLLTNLAAGSVDPAWENAAWYKGPGGQTLPVVEALRRSNLRGRVRKHTPTPVPGSSTMALIATQPSTTATPVAPRQPSPTLSPIPQPTQVTPTRSRIPPTGLDTIRLSETDGANEDVTMGVRTDAHQLAIGVASDSPLKGWLLLWRDGELVQSWNIVLSPGRPFIRTWRLSDAQQHKWGLQLADSQGALLQSYGQAGRSPKLILLKKGSQARPRAPQNGSRTGVRAVFSVGSKLKPTPVAPSKAAAAPGRIAWDPRLDELGIQLQPAIVTAREAYWRLVEAKYLDPQQAQGRHHIYVRMLDEAGQPLAGQTVWVRWADGQERLVSRVAASPWAWANFPMYGPLGAYQVTGDGVSDAVQGLGLPAKHHVAYLLTFQRYVAP